MSENLLRSSPQKMPIFFKNFEIEINAWEDSPSSALSETLLFFLWHLYFGQNFRWFLLTSCWKLCLFWKKRKMFFVFSQFAIFWSFVQDFSVQALSIYLNFFCLKERVEMQGNIESFFFIKLCFLLGVRTKTLIFGAFFWIIELVSLFLHEKSKN